MNNNIVTLKLGLEVTQASRSLKLVPFKRFGARFLFAFYGNYGRIGSRL